MNVLERARELVELGDKATPAPWIYEQIPTDLGRPIHRISPIWNSAGFWWESNNTFIAHARNHAPDIARTLIDAESLMREAVENCEICRGTIDCARCITFYDFINRIGVGE